MAAVLGEMTIVFVTKDFENSEEAKKHLHKDLMIYLNSRIESVTGYKGTVKALDVTDLEIYEDIG